MVDSSLRFSQSDVHEGFLNLYGIGDGGPSRRHIEWALRGGNCEGTPKIRMARAEEFFQYLKKEKGAEGLPLWCGELYLENHRGTSSSQAAMKRNNRRLELKLREVEFLGALGGAVAGAGYDAPEMMRIWKETHLNPFHDVLPDSSITEVYEDAAEMCERNLSSLAVVEEALVEKLFPDAREGALTVINTQPRGRTEILSLDGGDVSVTVPPLGYRTLTMGVRESMKRC